MLVLTSLLAGLVFGLGLIFSGMANPAKVIAFLDLADAWDPSLALVMTGAIALGVVAFGVACRRTVSFIGAEMKLTTPRHIDRRLVMGSGLFGVGWGVAGFCPGPAPVALGMGEAKALVFVAAMQPAWASSSCASGESRRPPCAPPDVGRWRATQKTAMCGGAQTRGRSTRILRDIARLQLPTSFCAPRPCTHESSAGPGFV